MHLILEFGFPSQEDIPKDSSVTQISREPRTGRRIQRIYTALHGTSCGVSFRIGREYIIAGFIQNNRRWSAQLCSWNVETTSLTPFQRKALRNGFYRNNCFCEINAACVLYEAEQKYCLEIVAVANFAGCMHQELDRDGRCLKIKIL
uniref:Uncharacterized protein n=1 Tax=Magallana gigas TaxID=29159 RepID=A0A8W8MI20_MAGGI